MSTEPSDISQLSAAQQEALQTYTSVTDQDPIAAIPLLQRAEWNVQIAVTRFYEGEPTTDILAEAQAAVPPPSSRRTANLQYESLLSETQRPPRAPPGDIVQRVDTGSNIIPQYQPGLLLSVLFTPVNILYRVFSTVLSPFAFLVPSFVTRILSNLLTTPRPNRRPLPPAETAHRFIREFSETYPSDTSLSWQETGFNMALENAKKTQKFLLVVLLSPSHDHTYSYVRETLQTTPFRSFLSSHADSVLLWGGNVQDAEAYQVSTNLNCTKFPFAALVCQTPNSPSSTSANGGNMTVVLRAVGPMSASELTAKLGAAITSHQAALRAARAQQAEQQASRTLREEQDSAYERSLAQDRERARQRREEEEARKKAEEEVRRREEAIEIQKRKKQQWRRWRAKSVPSEPPSGPDTIRVSIRMTDGERVIRRFRSDETVEEATNTDGATSDSKPDDYSHEYTFRLVSPMPRTVYELNQPGPVGTVIGKGANLIVETIHDDDDDEEEEEDHTLDKMIEKGESSARTGTSAP